MEMQICTACESVPGDKRIMSWDSRTLMSETIYNNGMAVLCLYRGDDNISQWGGNPYLSGGTNTSGV